MAVKPDHQLDAGAHRLEAVGWMGRRRTDENGLRNAATGANGALVDHCWAGQFGPDRNILDSWNVGGLTAFTPSLGGANVVRNRWLDVGIEMR